MAILVDIGVDVFSAPEVTEPLACAALARGPVGGAAWEAATGRLFTWGAGVDDPDGRGRSGGAGVAVGVGFADVGAAG